MAGVDVNKIWTLKRCARSENYVYANQADSSQFERNYLYGNDKTEWTYFSSGDETLELCLTESRYFTVRQGNLVIENISLLGAKDTLRVIAKGDSILVIYKMLDKNRKFRVQFKEHGQNSGVEQCQHFIKELCNYVDVKFDNYTVMSNSTGIADIIESITDPSNCTISEASATQPIDSLQLEEAVVCCLLDDTFPSFVESVEKCLKKLGAL